MNNLIENTKYFSRYIENFGYEGAKFLFNKKFTKKRVLDIRPEKIKHPIWLRRDTSDNLTFDQIFLYREYNILPNFKPKVIMDCGANIGLAAIYFHSQYPDARIISLEPEERNFELLKKNTAHYHNIHPVRCGLWSRSANLVVEENRELAEWGFTVKEVDYANEQTIKGVGIADLMKDFNISEIDILKIDIEGSEKELFEGNFEEWLPFTKILIIELHDRTMPGASRAFFKALVNYDFTMTQRGENIICCMNGAAIAE